MMKRALICTVGVGTGIQRPISKSIKDHNPTKVVLLASEESKDKAESIIDDFESDFDMTFESVFDPDDLQTCYDKSLTLIDELSEEGFDKGDIFLNITSGTKPMSAGLALAGVAQKCGSFTYITGSRDGDGRVINGTERIYSMEPILPIADSLIAEARTYFDKHSYEMALNVSKDVLKYSSEKRIHEEAKFISTLSEGYFKWDIFKHKEAIDFIEDVDAKILAVKQQDKFGMNLSHLKNCIEEKKSKAGLGEYLIVDLFANLLRRMDEGKYDDAVARCYRCLEMLGQWKLWDEHGLHHADIDISPEYFTDSQVKILKRWKGKNSQLSVGLKKVWEILGMVDIDLPEDPIKEKGFLDILAARNTSILAHGSEPISKSSCEKFKDKLKEELQESIDGFDSKLEKAKHLKLGEI